jgi:hypothetical protein
MPREAQNSTTGHARRVDRRVSKMFESPFLIRSPEAPADLSDIGNGHEHAIVESIDKTINGIPKSPGNSDPFETPFLDE